MNSSISPVNNTTSFISGSGYEKPNGIGATPGHGAATARTLDSSYDAHYGPANMCKHHQQLIINNSDKSTQWRSFEEPLR